MALFGSDFLSKLEYLSIVSRRVFRGKLLAQQKTRQLGSGIEFADHRDYSPGDDFRYIDWNLYARHDELLLKRFQEEEDLHLYILVDCSPSMEFGTPPKYDLARQMAAALAYISLSNLDRVSITGFSDGMVKHFPLTRGKAQILSLMKFLETLPIDGTDTNLKNIAKSFVLRPQKPGLVIVISDFFDPNGFEEGLNLLRHYRYETHVIHLYDKKEAEPGLRGELELLDMENQNINKVTITERGLRQYQDIFRDYLVSVQTYCRRYGMGCTTSTADVAFDELILNMLQASMTVKA
jgi:uncharacterized protein (DUF58 family)